MSAWYRLAWLPYGEAPQVVDLGSEALLDLLRTALVRSLDATVHLETHIVNPVASWIADGGSDGVCFTDAERRAAERLFEEEEAHAEAAQRLRSVAELPGHVRLRPAFADRLERRVRGTELPEALVRFLFVTVTETTLSARLRDHATEPDLRDDVRELLARHARDEAWHARFFARCAPRVLDACCSGREAAAARAVLPLLVGDYVDVDVAAMELDLAAAGLEPPAIAAVRRGLDDREQALREPHLQRLDDLLRASAEVA